MNKNKIKIKYITYLFLKNSEIDRANERLKEI